MSKIRKRGNMMKNIWNNKSKVIVSISFIVILILVIILSSYLKNDIQIITLAGDILNSRASNVMQKTVGSGLESAYIEWEMLMKQLDIMYIYIMK